MSKEKTEVTVDRILSSKNGRWPVFIKLFVLVAAAGIISEIIGTKTIPLGSVGKVNTYCHGICHAYCSTGNTGCFGGKYFHH